MNAVGACLYLIVVKSMITIKRVPDHVILEINVMTSHKSVHGLVSDHEKFIVGQVDFLQVPEL